MAQGRANNYRRLAAATTIVLTSHAALMWLMIQAGPQRTPPQAALVALWLVPAAQRPAAHTVSRAKPGRTARHIPAPTVPAPVVIVTPATPTAIAPSGPDSREKLVQALQNHAGCAALVRSGRPVPVTCHMGDLAGQTPLGPRPDADFQAAAAQVDARLKYKATPGNDDYWKRVAHGPGGHDLHLCSDRPGTYANAKDQRVWRCWAPDPANGVASP